MRCSNRLSSSSGCACFTAASAPSIARRTNFACSHAYNLNLASVRRQQHTSCLHRDGYAMQTPMLFFHPSSELTRLCWECVSHIPIYEEGCLRTSRVAERPASMPVLADVLAFTSAHTRCTAISWMRPIRCAESGEKTICVIPSACGDRLCRQTNSIGSEFTKCSMHWPEYAMIRTSQMQLEPQRPCLHADTKALPEGGP